MTSTAEQSSSQKEVVVQITDMVGYSSRTSDMSVQQIRDFILRYHRQLSELVTGTSTKGAQEYKPLAGDSSVTIYADGPGLPDKSIRAVRTAIAIAIAIENQQLIPTRIGLFTGNIIETEFNDITLSVGNSFSAASRLEQLCRFFGTHLLFDRELAHADQALKQYMVSIGKVTPKNFQHPVHVFSAYMPGLHHCPPDVDESRLLAFIATKNTGMDYFTGNEHKGIPCNFPQARDYLTQALDMFRDLTGVTDLATQRILEYIGQHPTVTDEFSRYGMRLNSTSGENVTGTRLLRLPEKLLKALDNEYHKALVQNTEWELYFQLEWIKQGDVIFRKGELPDGVYYIESGTVLVTDSDSGIHTTLGEGDIFGEMAYFSATGVRNSDVIAQTDIVVRKISGTDFIKFPEIRKVFSEIVKKRLPGIARNLDITP